MDLQQKSLLMLNDMKYHTFLICFLTCLLRVSAQDNKTSTVKTIDGITSALLEQITIEKGEKIDTARVRDLFHPTAQLAVNNASNTESVELNEFLVLLTDPYYGEGYLEKEIYKIVNEYNGIAQVFQTFYGEHNDGSKERGINSYQLTYHDDRWWILNLLWDNRI